MLDESTLAVVRALARGIDPSTGEALPPGDACQQPETIRALCKALAVLEATPQPQPSRRAPASAPKAGLPWDAAEDEALAQAFDQGASVTELAQLMQRTRGGIEARLVRLGKMTPPPGLRLREPVGFARHAES